MARGASEHGFDPSCGNYGVRVVRTESHFKDCASMEVEYEEFVDYDEHTLHRSIIPWNGGKVSDAYVERLLDSANVPGFIQDVSAFDMIRRCVDEILRDQERPQLSSVKVSIMSDRDTADFSEVVGDGAAYEDEVASESQESRYIERGV